MVQLISPENVFQGMAIYRWKLSTLLVSTMQLFPIGCKYIWQHWFYVLRRCYGNADFSQFLVERKWQKRFKNKQNYSLQRPLFSSKNNQRICEIVNTCDTWNYTNVTQVPCKRLSSVRVCNLLSNNNDIRPSLMALLRPIIYRLANFTRRPRLLKLSRATHRIPYNRYTI